MSKIINENNLNYQDEKFKRLDNDVNGENISRFKIHF
jgi:hypothetical protein